MSSSTLTTIANELTLYGGPICVILGNIGNVFIAIIFSRQRQSACAVYLVSSAVANSVYLTFYSIASIFILYYPDRTIRTIIFCKIYTYIQNFVGQVPKMMLILACIDRFLITNIRASFRAFSTTKRAKYLIFFSIIFWSLFTIHAPIMITVINGQCTSSGVYKTIYYVYLITVVTVIPIITLTIFGYLTYRNMRQMQNRVQPVVQNRINANIPIRRRDRNLLILVIAEVVTYVLTTTLPALVVLEFVITQYVMPNKSFQYFQIEIFISNIATFLLSINSAAPFYTYFISSKSFRQDFKQLFIHTYRRLTRQARVGNVFRTNRTST
jgi:hypothetical protein